MQLVLGKVSEHTKRQIADSAQETPLEVVKGQNEEFWALFVNRYHLILLVNTPLILTFFLPTVTVDDGEDRGVPTLLLEVTDMDSREDAYFARTSDQRSEPRLRNSSNDSTATQQQQPPEQQENDPEDDKVYLTASIDTSNVKVNRSEVTKSVLSKFDVNDVLAVVKQPRSWQVTFKDNDHFIQFINQGSITVGGSTFPVRKVAERDDRGQFRWVPYSKLA